MDFVEFVVRMLLVFRGLLGPAVIGFFIYQDRGISQGSLLNWAALCTIYFFVTWLLGVTVIRTSPSLGILLWGYDRPHIYFHVWQLAGFAAWFCLNNGICYIDGNMISFGVLFLLVQQFCLRAMNPYSSFSTLEELDEPRRRINEYTNRFPPY